MAVVVFIKGAMGASSSIGSFPVCGNPVARRLFLAAISFLLLVRAASGSVGSLPVFLIEVKKQIGVSFGTSFYLQTPKGRFLITANHVVSGAVGPARVQIDGIWFEGILVATDSSTDLAALATLAPIRHEPLSVRSYSARNSEPVAAVGFPLPDVLGVKRYVVSTGVVHDFTTTPRGISGFGFSAPVSSGASGGPVLDSRRNVIGIIAFARRDTFNGYAVHAFYIEKLLGR